MSRLNPSPGEILVQLPWQVSATLAVLSFAALRWVLPAVGSDNTFFKAFFPALAQIAWIPAVGFGLFAVLSAFLARRKRALLDEQSGAASLRNLDWKEFEWLVGEAYRRQGYTIDESLGGGADGGIDLALRKGGATWLVQCKQWRTQAVGAPVLREIWGLVSHHQVHGAIVITSGRFTREAHAFAEGKTLELIDGPQLLALVKSVQRGSPPRSPVSPSAVPSPIAIPSCPQCGASMVRRTARKGANAGNDFWGCSTYPRCRGVVNG
jgi:restriction system protein